MFKKIYTKIIINFFHLLPNAEMLTNIHSKLTFLVYPNRIIEIIKFIPRRMEIETKYLFPFHSHVPNMIL